MKNFMSLAARMSERRELEQIEIKRVLVSLNCDRSSVRLEKIPFSFPFLTQNGYFLVKVNVKCMLRAWSCGTQLYVDFNLMLL